MTRAVVCDASALVALLLDAGEDGRWASEAVGGAALLAPDLAVVEAANIMRRVELCGLVSADQAALAHADLLDLGIQLWPYEWLARRAWELRLNLTIYDASYVALAEQHGIPLVTLDRRITTAPGVQCQVLTPEARSGDVG